MSVAAQSTDPLPVLIKAREALGGDKKLSSIKTIVAQGQTRQVRGDNLVPIVFEINIELPGKYSRRDETPAVESGYSTSGFSGDELIQLPQPTMPVMPPMAQRPGGPPPPTPEQIAAQLAAQRKTRVATLKQDYARLMLGLFASSTDAFPLTFVRTGIAESPQGKAEVIAVSGPNNFKANLLINQETHLPVMVSWTPATPNRPGAPGASGASRAAGAGSAGAATPPSRAPANPAPAAPAAPASPAAPENRLYFADYRDAGGVMWPYRIRRAVGSETVEETTFDRFKLNAKIDPKKFEVVK
ncbi:MAG: hypothetical protein EPO35_09975 [Acidobacteria bacterium]|nr:MAG: hypothetical protein EPO35_09975 [Acidobacteriota bacterium]